MITFVSKNLVIVPEEILKKYIRYFNQLKRGVTKYGLAPHKPIMLLSILQGIKGNIINENRIFVTPELIFLFKNNWNSLVKTHHVSNFALPFFHLHREKSGFWNLITKPGFEPIISNKESISSLTELNNMIQFATISEELFQLMKEEASNLCLQQNLIDYYFSNSNFSVNYDSNHEVNNLNSLILNESPEVYKREIKSLIEEKDEDEIFLRGSLFKREIPKIYNNTCCISGMRIEASISISMVDACHIVPFSVSFDDTIKNGIALCPNLHRAFDRGLIAINSNYSVVISKKFSENENQFGIKNFENKQIKLPENAKYYPSTENLNWHYNNTFKKD
jgi:putative restriction endonuclease